MNKLTWQWETYYKEFMNERKNNFTKYMWYIHIYIGTLSNRFSLRRKINTEGLKLPFRLKREYGKIVSD